MSCAGVVIAFCRRRKLGRAISFTARENGRFTCEPSVFMYRTYCAETVISPTGLRPPSYAAFLERRRLLVLLFLALLQSLRGIGAESGKPALIRGKREMQPYSPRPDPKDQFHLRARLHALCRMVFVFQVLAHISAVRKPCLIKIPLCPADLSAEQESKGGFTMIRAYRPAGSSASSSPSACSSPPTNSENLPVARLNPRESTKNGSTGQLAFGRAARYRFASTGISSETVRSEDTMEQP